MGLRALSTTILPPPGLALAPMPSMANSARKFTLVSNDTDHDDNELRDTLPPSPLTEPPPGFDPLPSEALKRMTGYEPDLFLHAALMAAADAAHEVRQSNKASSNIAVLLEKQTERILRETGADIGLIRSSITGLQQSVDALVTRQGVTEQEQRNIALALDAGAERFQQIELDMAVMRTQLDRMDRELAVLRAVQDAKKPE